MLLVAKYCIEFRKDKSWPTPGGCYGFPAALILLSIADSIGSYIEQGNVKNHFKILNNEGYYSLELDNDTLEVIRKYYRDTLSHHTVLTPSIMLDIGQANDKVIQRIKCKYLLRLVPFYSISVVVVNKFLNNPSVFVNNRTIENIRKKI